MALILDRGLWYCGIHAPQKAEVKEARRVMRDAAKEEQFRVREQRDAAVARVVKEARAWVQAYRTGPLDAGGYDQAGQSLRQAIIDLERTERP